MSRNATKKTIFLAAVIVTGFFVVFLLSSFIEKNRPALSDNYADEDLTLQGARLKGYSLGAEGLIADWYWMRALQYLGEKILNNPEAKISLDNLNSLNPRLLYPYLDSATTLDPQFMSVYEFGATVLPAIDKNQAIKLLEKGIEKNPDQWRLYQHLGFIYWRLGDYEKASEVYAQGAKVSNAPPFMLMMAAKTKTEGGSRETARVIYRQMLDEATDTQIKQNAEVRLMQLDSLDERDAIKKVLVDFQSKNNHCPNNWREVFLSLKDIKLPDNRQLRFDKNLSPVDPSAAAYVLSSKENSCTVNLDSEKTKIPLD